MSSFVRRIYSSSMYCNLSKIASQEGIVTQQTFFIPRETMCFKPYKVFAALKYGEYEIGEDVTEYESIKDIRHLKKGEKAPSRSISLLKPMPFWKEEGDNRSDNITLGRVVDLGSDVITMPLEQYKKGVVTCWQEIDISDDELTDANTIELGLSDGYQKQKFYLPPDVQIFPGFYLKEYVLGKHKSFCYPYNRDLVPKNVVKQSLENANQKHGEICLEEIIYNQDYMDLDRAYKTQIIGYEIIHKYLQTLKSGYLTQKHAYLGTIVAVEAPEKIYN